MYLFDVANLIPMMSTPLLAQSAHSEIISTSKFIRKDQDILNSMVSAQTNNFKSKATLKPIVKLKVKPFEIICPFIKRGRRQLFEKIEEMIRHNLNVKKMIETNHAVNNMKYLVLSSEQRAIFQYLEAAPLNENVQKLDDKNLDTYLEAIKVNDQSQWNKETNDKLTMMIQKFIR